MRQLIKILAAMVPAVSLGQAKMPSGAYINSAQAIEIRLHPDHSFEYTSNGLHPVFFFYEHFSEKGKWILAGDTVILNPGLKKKPFVESEFREEKMAGDSAIRLSFSHIKRYLKADGELIRADTVQIERLDFAFNQFRKKNRRRVAPRKTTRCAFAGYIPEEIITASRSISLRRPPETLQSIIIGCYELQGIKEFTIHDPHSNHFTFNVCSNYYQDGLIRQIKLLVKNEKSLSLRRKENGMFIKGILATRTNMKLIRKKE